ncbi:MAG: hypothetical protein HC887_00470 [Desulfobacteraceae bacterium]|nr:hypothetical protein [Desulfobacteraceae bacterium]
MKRLFFFCLMPIFLPAYLCAADYFDRLEFLTPNPVGSGARALGMGGAFIAIADDATAASWNPGGLVQLGSPEASVVSDMFHRTEDNTFSTNPSGNGIQRVSEANLNYLSAAYPFEFLERNMIVSLNYQRLYDFTRNWNFSIIRDSEGTTSDYHQNGELSAIGIAYGVRVVRNFYLGFTLNFWDNGLTPNQWKQEMSVAGKGNVNGYDFKSLYKSTDSYSFKGFNANIGLLWRPIEKLTIGAVLKTPFKADIQHEKSLHSSLQYTDIPDFDPLPYNASSSEDETLTMPLSFGIGIAYRFTHNFMTSFDIYRTEWNDFVHTDSEGNDTSPITGKSFDESDIRPTHQIRIGAEYLIITQKYIIPLCAGLFYDPAPAQGSPDDIFGVSLGSGIGIGKFHIDLAYQYRFGNSIGDSILKNLGFSQDLREHTLYSSVVFHF